MAVPFLLVPVLALRAAGHWPGRIDGCGLNNSAGSAEALHLESLTPHEADAWTYTVQTLIDQTCILVVGKCTAGHGLAIVLLSAIHII